MGTNQDGTPCRECARLGRDCGRHTPPHDIMGRQSARLHVSADALALHASHRQLSDLGEGESAWTVPWAAWSDENGTVWLSTRFTVSDSESSARMRVTRLGDGWVISLPDSEQHLLGPASRRDDTAEKVARVDWHPGDDADFLGDMPLMTSRWAAPWALTVADDGSVWADPDHRVSRERDSERTVCVWRDGRAVYAKVSDGERAGFARGEPPAGAVPVVTVPGR